MTIASKIRRTAAALGCAAALGIGLFTATPAQAQSATSTVPTAGTTAASAYGTLEKASALAPSAVTAASACDVIYFGTSSSAQMCYVATYYFGGDPYRWPVTEVSAAAFSNRVWLHQNKDGSGWAICVSGGWNFYPNPAYQDPGNIQLSANTAPC